MIISLNYENIYFSSIKFVDFLSIKYNPIFSNLDFYYSIFFLTFLILLKDLKLNLQIIVCFYY